MDTPSFSVTITPEIHAKLQDISAYEERSIQNILTKMIEDYIDVKSQEMAQQAQLDKLLDVRLQRIEQGEAIFYSAKEARAKTRQIINQSFEQLTNG